MERKVVKGKLTKKKIGSKKSKDAKFKEKFSLGIKKIPFVSDQEDFVVYGLPADGYGTGCSGSTYENSTDCC